MNSTLLKLYSLVLLVVNTRSGCGDIMEVIRSYADRNCLLRKKYKYPTLLPFHATRIPSNICDPPMVFSVLDPFIVSAFS